MAKVLRSLKIDTGLLACVKREGIGWSTLLYRYAARGLLSEMLAAGLTPPSSDLNESEIIYVYRLWQLSQGGCPLVKIADWKFKDRSGRWPVPVWITFNVTGFKVDMALQAQHSATLDALVDESELYANE